MISYLLNRKQSKELEKLQESRLSAYQDMFKAEQKLLELEKDPAKRWLMSMKFQSDLTTNIIKDRIAGL